MFFLGIDIAKTNHVASLIDADGSSLRKPIKFTNSKDGYQGLINSINEFIPNKDSVLIAMEATGHYWLALYSSLQEDGYNVSVYNPIQINSFRESFTIRKKKNDNIDSLIIAHFIRTFGSNSSSLPSDDMLSLKQLTRYRSNLIFSISSNKTQVLTVLDKVFPEYHTLFSDVFGESSKQLLLKCNTPFDILNFDTKKLTKLLNTASRGRFKIDTALHIKEVAKNSFGIKLTKDASSFEIKQLINQIIFIEEQVHALDEEIAAIYSKLDSHLLSVPGIGDVLAPIILSELGDIKKFPTPNKLVAFSGCDPSENQSGNKSSNNEKTSKRGSPHLRWAIHTAAFASMRTEPRFREFYDKKIAEGKHHHVALAGISRKLLFIIHAVLTEQRDYIPYDSIKNNK